MAVSQTDFRAALLNSEAPVPTGLTDPQGRPAGKRFNVYRNNVAVSLTEALRASFPCLVALLGDEFFDAMAGVFLRKYPPPTPLIIHYGAKVPDFLADFEPARQYGYLPDVARLELARRQAYHAADIAPIDPAALQSLPVERLLAARFRLAPAVRLIQSPWPVLSIWQFNLDNGPKPQMQAQDVLITRPDFDPVMTPLPAGGADFVASLAKGADFNAGVAAAGDGFDLTPVLGALISGGAITAIIEGEGQ